MSSHRSVKCLAFGVALLAFVPVAASYAAASKPKARSLSSVVRRLVGKLTLPSEMATRSATSIAWAAAANGNWNTPANWSPAEVPDVPGESAVISVAGTYTVTLNMSPSIETLDLTNSAATLSLGGNTLTVLSSPGLTIGGLVRATASPSVIVGRIVIGPSGELIVNQNCGLALGGPTVVNDGLLLINHTGGFDSFLRIDSDVQISGTGAMFINGDNDNDRIDGAAGVTLTNAAGHTIRGEGAINVAVNNQGDIVADESGHYLSLRSAGKTNSGRLLGTNGGILRVVATSVANTGGSIQADGGAVQLNGAVITGGTLLGPSIISGISDATLSGVTLATGAQYDVNQSTTTTLMGSMFVNNGLVRINHTGSYDSVLVIGESMTISGTGEIFINGDNDSDRIDGAAGVTLTNPAGHTIRGEGAINVALNNQGNVISDQAGGRLTLRSGAKTNAGTFRTANGGTLLISGTSVNNAGGLIRADNGAVQFSGAAISGGTLYGPSIISGISDATLSGVTLAAGAQYDVSQSTTTTLMGSMFVNNGLVRINHTGSYDSVLVIGESMTISGTGEIFINGDNDSDRIDGAAGVTLTNPAGHTIRGEGAINVALNNQGNVISDQASGRLTLQSGAKINTGTLRTANGGTLLISGTSVNNAGGLIRADNGAVQFSGAAITGGTLSGASVFSAISNTTLSGVTLAAGAQYDVNQSTTTTLLGSAIVNNGLLRVNHTGGWDSVLVIGESMTISGTGEIFINGDNDSDRIDGAALTLGPGQTLRGQGAVNVSLTNNGRVCASKGGRLNLATTAKISNGLFEAASPAVLLVSQDISGGGSWRASGGTVQLASGVQVTTTGSIRVTEGGVLQMLGTGNLTTGSDLFVDGGSQLSANGSLVLSGNVDFLTTSESLWNWAAGSSLTMTGAGTAGGIACNTSAWASLEVGSADNGTGGSGTNNFGLRQLIVAGGARVALADFRDNGNRGSGREALYAESLVIGSGGVLNLNGLKLYVAGSAIAAGPYGAGQVVNTTVVKVGDLNPDSVVDGRDVEAFVVGLFNPASYPIRYPGGNLCAGDTDFDGDLDVYDVAGFVTKLLTS